MHSICIPISLFNSNEIETALYVVETHKKASFTYNNGDRITEHALLSKLSAELT